MRDKYDTPIKSCLSYGKVQTNSYITQQITIFLNQVYSRKMCLIGVQRTFKKPPAQNNISAQNTVNKCPDISKENDATNSLIY